MRFLHPPSLGRGWVVLQPPLLSYTVRYNEDTLRNWTSHYTSKYATTFFIALDFLLAAWPRESKCCFYIDHGQLVMNAWSWFNSYLCHVSLLRPGWGTLWWLSLQGDFEHAENCNHNSFPTLLIKPAAKWRSVFFA